MNLDTTVVVRGAGYALSVVVPAAALNALGAALDSRPLILLGFLAIILGFVFGGYGAARTPTTTPLQHAAAAALAAFAVIQTVGLVIALARGGSVSPVGVLLTALLAACAGMLGALLAARSPVRKDT